jgi:hypothetical protein
MRNALRIVPAAVLLVIVVMLSACGGQRSTDPTIAMEQDWVQACGQMKAGMRTAIDLRTAGQLSETEIQIMDRIKTVYVSICTDDPQPLTSALTDVAVGVAIGELCPELRVDEDLVVTVAMAAVCAGRQYLLVQLEDTT